MVDFVAVILDFVTPNNVIQMVVFKELLGDVRTELASNSTF